MLRRDPLSRRWSVEIKHRTFGRVHLRLKTTQEAAAKRAEVALGHLLDAGEPVRDLVDALRARKLTLGAVEECLRQRRPFDSLRPSTWPTLGEARDVYLAAVDGRAKSAKTLKSIGHALAHAVTHFGEARALETITHEDVLAFRAYLLDPTRGNIASNTAGLYLTKFGALYAFYQKRENRRARQAKRIPATLFSPLDREEHIPPHQQTRVRFLSEDEAERLLAATPARVRLVVALGLFAGLRVGEIVHLRPGIDVDLEHGLLFIQAREGKPEGWQPKRGKNREIPISAVLRPYLEAHAAGDYQNEHYVFPAGVRGPEDGHRTERNVQEVFKAAVARADMEPGRDHPAGVTVHTLRHTFASWLVMAGADLLTIARLMGHSGIRQLLDTYGHLSPEHRRATVELLTTRWAGRGTPMEETRA